MDLGRALCLSCSGYNSSSPGLHQKGYFHGTLFWPQSFLWISSEVSGKDPIEWVWISFVSQLLGLPHCHASALSNLFKNNLNEGNLSNLHGVQHHLLQVNKCSHRASLLLHCVSLNFELVIWLVTSVLMGWKKSVSLPSASLFCYMDKIDVLSSFHPKQIPELLLNSRNRKFLLH